MSAGTVRNGNVTSLDYSSATLLFNGSKADSNNPKAGSDDRDLLPVRRRAASLAVVATCTGHLRMPIFSSYEQFKAAWTLAITEETLVLIKCFFFQVSCVVFICPDSQQMCFGCWVTPVPFHTSRNCPKRKYCSICHSLDHQELLCCEKVIFFTDQAGQLTLNDA
jgi:hypothetical protein